MLRSLTYGALASVVLLAGCDLKVVNPNDPETGRVLASPSDAEQLLASQYRRWHQGLYGAIAVYSGAATGQSFENYSSLANNCQNSRNPIPRPINDNSLGNSCNTEQSRVYYFHSEVMRVASTVLTQIEQPGFFDRPGRLARARSFGHFMRGLSLGYLAMLYDSAAVISPGMSTEDPGELVSFLAVRDSAMHALQLAIDYAQADPSEFPLTDDWMPTPSPMSATEFVRLARSYRARIRASVSRGPGQPGDPTAAEWQLIIEDAANGITSDHMIQARTTGNIGHSWLRQWYSYSTWSQMTPFIIGMGDVSGNYEAWINQPLDERGSSGSFFMITPDQRFPQGETRAAQQADFALTMCNTGGSTCKRYFVNRPSGNDQNVGAGWGWSNYDHARFWPWHIAGEAGNAANGPLVFMTKAEMDLLRAEGHIERGEYAQALPLINATRVANGGLPALTAADLTTPVPGTAQTCVPKMPVNADHDGGGTVVCGNLMEAMKWEKRIETLFTHFAAWFFDSRRWGDLAEGTPTYLAVPYADLLARGRPTSAIYSTGVGQVPGSAAPVSTYGW